MALETSWPTILLLGGGGQVGHELRSTLDGLGRLVALDVPDIDFGKPDSLRALIRGHRPSVIINAVAYTAVDKAETDAEAALTVNGVAPAVLAEEAAILGAILVHYSTDYVFDGEKVGAYVETDVPRPLSVYGRTKLVAEGAVGGCARHLTFRTSWVMGAHGANFIKTILRLAGEREILRVVDDQYGAPTSAALLAEATANILAQMIAASEDDSRWGLYHLVAAGETTWHGLARYVVARAHAAGVPLKCGVDAIEPISARDYPTPARRPSNSRLDTVRVRETFGLTLPDWRDGVAAVLDRILVKGAA